VHIAKAWSCFGPLEQFEYRTQLNAFSGKDWTAPEWEIDFWENRSLIRREWKTIEQSGKAEEWMKGVGTNGMEDWIEQCRVLIKQGRSLKG
jgi:hypothetical protein